MTLWTPQEFASGCWRSEHQYEGHRSTLSGKEFVIHATLDAGAHKHFSGIRVLVCCKDVQEGELAGLAITDNLGSGSLRETKPSEVEIGNMLLAQQNGQRLAIQYREGDAAAQPSLPLYSLLYEVVDVSDDIRHRVNLVLRPPRHTEQHLRTLYECVETSSSSLVLFLAINHTFRGTIKRKNSSCLVWERAVAMGVRTHGVRILPPSISREPFSPLPAELLYKIFEDAIASRNKSYSRWRRDLVSFALVCQAWRPALGYLFRDFGPYTAGRNPPDVMAVARVLGMNAELGRRIRVFSPNHFRPNKDKSEATDLAMSKAVVTILQSATLLTDLEIFDTHFTLAEEFVRALRCSPDIQRCLIKCKPLFREVVGRRYSYILSVADVLRCMSHWPRLRQAIISGLAASGGVEEAPIPRCAMESLLLYNSRITGSHLSRLTASSQLSLRLVSLKGISGLTNDDLRNWLTDIGPALKALGLEESIVSRRMDEEYALDAVIAQMANLKRLVLNGDFASELVLMRRAAPVTKTSKEHLSQRWSSNLSIRNAPGISAHGLVHALKFTGWTGVAARGVFPENHTELKEEAKGIAKDRDIYLWL